MNILINPQTPCPYVVGLLASKQLDLWRWLA